MTRTVVVTGATSGIGFAVVGQLLSLNYRVIGLGHSDASCKAASTALTDKYPQASLVFFAADLMQQREVNRVADELSHYLETRCNGELYALINNAGGVRSWYATTEEGYEQQFALNHLAGFMLTGKLLPFLQKPGGRIIFTGSGSHKGCKINWQDIMFKNHYSALKAYKQTKLCNMLLARELNNRYLAQGIRAYVVDPGLVKTDIGNKNTGGLVNFVWSWRKKHGQPPEIPARTYTYLCEQADSPAGLYYAGQQARNYSRQVTNVNARRLFLLSEQLCGIQFGGSE